VAKVCETHLFLQGFQQTFMHEYLSTGDHFSRLGGVEGVDVGVIWMVTGEESLASLPGSKSLVPFSPVLARPMGMVPE